MKKILAVFNIILILIFFIGTTAVYADITEEDISIVKNPDRGLYKLVQVELQNEEENFDDRHRARACRGAGGWRDVGVSDGAERPGCEHVHGRQAV